MSDLTTTRGAGLRSLPDARPGAAFGPTCIFLPFLLETGREPACAHTLLPFTADEAVARLLRGLEDAAGAPVPSTFASYVATDERQEHTIYGDVTENPTGTPLRWLPAGQIVALLSRIEVMDWRTSAVIAYLERMPEHWPVAIFWQ